LRRAFHFHVLDKDDLDRLLAQVIRECVDEVSAIENEMLVRLRADVADLPQVKQLAVSLDHTRVQRIFQKALVEAMAKTGTQIQHDVATEIVSTILGEVMTQLAVRLGVSSGALAAGSATSPWTFGIGFVVGVVVGEIVQWVWDWYTDPTGDMAAMVRGKLDTVHSQLQGSEAAGDGLHGTLLRFAREREQLRRAAIETLLNQECEQP
jgi:hypothetical protein